MLHIVLPIGDENDHLSQLTKLCRLCGSQAERQKCCTKYSSEFLKIFGIDLSADIATIHPTSICHKCRCLFDRYKREQNPENFETHTKPYTFKQHDDSCNICFRQTGDHSYHSQQQRGRKRKKTGIAGPGRGKKRERDVENLAVNTSTSQATTSTQTNTTKAEIQEKERDVENPAVNTSTSQATTRTQTNATKAEIGTQTDSSQCGYVIDADEPDASHIPLPILCKLVKSAAQSQRQTDSSQCGYVIDADEPDASHIPLPILCKLVKSAAQSQRHPIREDISTVTELHKDPLTLTNIDHESYYSNRNSLCTSFVDGLTDKKTTVASKVITLEQMYHLVSPVFVAPFTFARNLLCYAITNSKLAVNMLGKVSPGGMIETVKSYMETMADKPLQFPRGDCEVAIDNDQKLKKQWSVRAHGKMTCSVLTSVCQVEHDTQMNVQSRADLAPASWGNYIKEAQEDEQVADRLKASLKPSKRSGDIHRTELRKMIHERLSKVANQQQFQDGQYVDHVDACVTEKEKKKDWKQCCRCGEEVPKTKRLCPNEKCRVNLKEAEDAANRKDVYGTMVLAPIRKYSYRPKETEISFDVDSDQTTLIKKDTTVITTEEYASVPSGHPDIPPPITMSDPVFVNPNSASSMRKVLRHIGKISNIGRYNDESPSSRKWMIVAMDGLPLGITRSVINDTIYCSSCKSSFLSMELFTGHVKESHAAEDIPAVREFDWVVLRVGKLHLEMNAVKSFVELNWEVWFSALAEEMGFRSEGAQRVAKNCADHHKSMQLLEIAIKGTTDEMLVPYVREKLQKGEQQSMSADDFLYVWCPALRNPNFMFLQQQINLYGVAILNFRAGTRRNNSEYVQAGAELFSPLFSGRNHPKYQLIDMLDSMDRAMYPEDLKVFMEQTESVSSTDSSHGEGMDAKLEEKNKASKAWHKGAPVAADWVRVFRNLDVLQKLRARFFQVIGVEDGGSQRSSRYNLEPEVDVWRTRLRADNYLADPFDKDATHKSITGKALTTDLISFETTSRKNKMNVFNAVVLQGKQRSDVEQKIVRVTEDEKCWAEDITRQTKDTIVKKMKELLSEFVVDDVQSYYMEKVSMFDEKKIKETGYT
ncbi:uncharacterized protein LOC144879762 isoform X1 [Branchiostoma floridae x Branchiostoma japonicum]